jgi:hypothetical protein
VPLGSASRWQDRLDHVVIHTIYTRHADHSRPLVFNVSAIPGSALTAALSNAYQPQEQRNLAGTAQRFAWNLAGYIAGDAFVEFRGDMAKLWPWHSRGGST